VSPIIEALSGASAPPPQAAVRIVSLVPSITESLFSLGLGDRLVGVTDWCVHPAAGVAPLPKLGGTKDPDVAAIARLAPDLVIANHEENTRRVVAQLDGLGLCVWVTYPRTVREGCELLLELTQLCASDTARREIAEPVLHAVARAERTSAARAPRPRVFCPIWRDPWMAPGPDTYAHDMITLCGGTNLYPSATAADPKERRYPRLSLDALQRLSPDVILLPDEPYAFAESDVRELAALDVPAAANRRIHLIDGTWVSWYGPRIRVALHELELLLR
jgi:ABC-type hemin transport system substrate-binding protein